MLGRAWSLGAGEWWVLRGAAEGVDVLARRCCAEGAVCCYLPGWSATSGCTHGKAPACPRSPVGTTDTEGSQSALPGRAQHGLLWPRGSRGGRDQGRP